MKKLFLFAAVVTSVLVTNIDVQAQSNWEVGVRFGDSFSADVTIPFKAPRIHAAAYFANDFALGGYFDWMFALDGGPTGLKFYPGVGPEFYFGNSFEFGIAGDEHPVAAVLGGRIGYRRCGRSRHLRRALHFELGCEVAALE